MVNYYTELGTDMLVLGLTLLQYLQLIVRLLCLTMMSMLKLI